MSYNISPAQVQKIKVLAKKVWGDPKHPEYYEMLRGQAGVSSCKDLKGPKIDLVIRHLERSAGQEAGPKTMSQAEYILHLWDRVSFKQPGREREKALQKFVRRFGVAAVEWLDLETGSQVIEALRDMLARKGAKVRRSAG